MTELDAPEPQAPTRWYALGALVQVLLWTLLFLGLILAWVAHGEVIEFRYVGF